jgi:hypothetical protein
MLLPSIVRHKMPKITGVKLSVAGAKACNLDPLVTPEFHFAQSCDAVFDEHARQSEVYEATAGSLIQHVFKGSNCAMLASGPTGSGKFHTMMGFDDGSQNTRHLRGVIPRFLDAMFGIFDENKRSNLLYSAQVSLSCLRIMSESMNERIHDLLHYEWRWPALRTQQSETKGIYIKGAVHRVVKNYAEAKEALDEGHKRDTVSVMEMNTSRNRYSRLYIPASSD